MTERQALVGQALDIAQHMATAYRQAPEHIRRMLNHVLFDKVYITPDYITPDDETGLLTAIVRYQPPFDGVLGVRGGEPCLSKEGVEVGDGDNLEASGDDEVTLSQPSDIVVSASEGPGLHGLPDDGLPAPKPSTSKQKPTSWGFHDVGLSVDSMVGVTGLKPATSRSQTARAINCATPRYVLYHTGDHSLPEQNMVGVTGFEPATSPSRTVRATKLRHTPRYKTLPSYHTI